MRLQSECQLKMALFKAWITEISANPSLVTRAVEEGLYQLGYKTINPEQLTAVERLLKGEDVFISVPMSERGLFTRGETPVLANGDGRGRLSEWLGHGCRGGVFTVPSALCMLQGSTGEAGTPCSFSTSSFLEFSKRSFCFAAVQLQDLHTNSERSLAGKSSPATVLSWLYNSVGPLLLCSDCCNRYCSMGFRLPAFIQSAQPRSRFTARGASAFQLVGVISTR